MQKKYHIVRSGDLKKVAQFLTPCPSAHRQKGEGAVRQCPQFGEFVTNFAGSEDYRNIKKYSIDWTTTPCGTEVGMIQGLSI